jgi:hypothetical protein
VEEEVVGEEGKRKEGRGWRIGDQELGIRDKRLEISG